jgi:hypothetical protein
MNGSMFFHSSALIEIQYKLRGNGKKNDHNKQFVKRLGWLAEALSSLPVAGSSLALGPDISPGGIYFSCSPDTLCPICSMLKFSTSD